MLYLTCINRSVNKWKTHWCNVFEGSLSFSMGGKQCGNEKLDCYLLDLGLEQKHSG